MTERIKAKDFRGGLFAGGKKGPQPIAPKEQAISKGIQEFLDRKGIYNDRLNSGKVEVVKHFRRKDGTAVQFNTWLQLCKKGTPDRFAIIPPSLDPLKRGGFMLMIEVKQLGKKPTPEQLERHRELRDAGAMVFVADSIDGFIRKWKAVFEQEI